MSLHGIERRLREIIAAEEVGIVGEEGHAGSELECPGTNGLRNPELGLERPAIVAEVEQLAVVVLPERRGNLKADANNEILPVVRKVLHRQRRGPDQIDRNAKSRITQARHLALPRLAVDKAPGGEGRRRHDHIELGRLACEIERPDIGQQSGVGMEIGVGDRQVRIERQFALGIKRACDQEIQPDRRIRIGSWLRILGFRNRCPE